jgi:hypothetical protein
MEKTDQWIKNIKNVFEIYLSGNSSPDDLKCFLTEYQVPEFTDDAWKFKRPMCTWAVETGNIEIVKYFFELFKRDFDPEDDYLQHMAIDKSHTLEDYDILKYVLSIVPTVEKWEMVSHAERLENEEICKIINYYVESCGWYYE